MDNANLIYTFTYPKRLRERLYQFHLLHLNNLKPDDASTQS